VSRRVRYSAAARDDIKRLYRFLLEQDTAVARRALDAINKGVDLLREFPFTCRKVDAANPLLRELVISFGAAGYVALFEIDDAQSLTILAVRHQREDDYY